MQRKKKLSMCIPIALMLCSFFCHGQDFRELIREMRKDYSQCKSLRVVMEVTVYDSAQSHPYYRQRVEIKRDGNNYWYQFEENEMMLNEKCLILVDKETRQISYSQRNREAEAELKKGFQFNLDSILMQYDTFEYLGKADSTEHYRVIEKSGPIKEVHFFIIPQGYRLSKIAYKYREGQYAAIRFLVFDKKASFDANTFSESRYVTSVKNRIVPSGFFKKYAISYQ